MATNEEILVAELDNDPEELGYAAAGWSQATPSEAQYQAIVDLINAKDISQAVPVEAWRVFSAIVPAHFQSLANGQRSYINSMLGVGTVDLSNPGIQSALQSIFSGDSLAAISALVSIISRARELGLPRIKVGHLRHIKGDV